MRMTLQQKEAMELYALDLIDRGTEGAAGHIAEVFSVDRSTAFRCLARLKEKNLIAKVKRNEYILTEEEWTAVLKRNEGELDSDIEPYIQLLEPHLADFQENIRQIWSYVFSEMINNVIDHSGSDEAFVRIRQDFLRTTVCLVDRGVGVFEKIKDYFGFKNTDESIDELFKGKLTTDRLHHSGEGIFFSSRMMDEFAVISGGKMFTCNHFDAEERAELTGQMNFRGTFIYMRLSNRSPKSPKDVFDRFSDDDGNFIRTKIPLKNMFDSAPVSRSQARRLTNRLKEFQEIVLDFKEVEWIGQGFADQLFRVFANENPGIRLIPENCSGDVMKMIRHAGAKGSPARKGEYDE